MTRSAREQLRIVNVFARECTELSELERVIRRFNVFDALGCARAEIRHSNFLAWLLNPEESHGLGDSILRKFLADIMARAWPSSHSGIALADASLGRVTVRREWRRIDVLVEVERPAVVLAIENKIESSEHGDQLHRYHKTLAAAFPASTVLPIFLTTGGERASHGAWVPYSYRDLYHVLSQCRGSCDQKDVRTFLDHYLRLVGSWFMDDPKVDELCRTIYAQHRQALDLIYDRIRVKPLWLLDELETTLRELTPECHIYRLSAELGYAPLSWLKVLPSALVHDHHEDWKELDRRLWISLYFTVTPSSVDWHFWAGPIEDAALWERTVDRLTRDPRGFGLRRGKAHPREPHNIDLAQESLVTWERGTPPDADTFRRRAAEALASLRSRLGGIPDALASVTRSAAAGRRERKR